MLALLAKQCNWLIYGSLFAIAAASCQREGGERTIITFWAMGAEGEHVQKLTTEFERLNPGIRVKGQAIPWTAAHEKLLTAFAGSSTPDVCQLGNTWIPEFHALNAIEPLDSWIEQSTVIESPDYFRGIWETNEMEGSMYGIPWYVDTRVLFYRKDILSRVGFPDGPQTWEDLAAACDRIVQSSPAGKRYGIFLPTNEWQPAVLFGLEAGSQLLRDNNTRGNFSADHFLQGFAFLRSFYARGLAPASWMEIQNVYQGFAEGYIAMYITGPWNIGEFSRRLPPQMQDLWMTAPLPGKTAARPGVSLPGGSSLVLFRSSVKKHAAWKLVEFLSLPETQIEFYKLTGNLPARMESWRDSSLASNPHMQAFLKQLQHLAAPPKIPEWEQIAMKVMEYAEKGALQNLASEAILTMLDREVDKILEKRRWLHERRTVGNVP